jgi:hypothetical protein
MSVVMPAVAVSGFKIVVMGDGFARRNRFILSCALALGLGVTLAPQVRLLNSLKCCQNLNQKAVLTTRQDMNLRRVLQCSSWYQQLMPLLVMPATVLRKHTRVSVLLPVLLQWASNNLWPMNPNASQAAQSGRMAIMLILETGAAQ